MFEHFRINRRISLLERSIPEPRDLPSEFRKKLRNCEKALNFLAAHNRFMNKEQKATFVKLRQLLQEGEHSPSMAEAFAEDLRVVLQAFLSPNRRSFAVLERLQSKLKGQEVLVSKSHRSGTGSPLSQADFHGLSAWKALKTIHGLDPPHRSWHKLNGASGTALKASLIELSKHLPTNQRLNVLRGVGVHIGNDVMIGQNVQFDYFFPELISIGHNVKIGNNAKLWTHDYSLNKFSFSALTIGDNVIIGDGCLIGPVTIGAGAHIERGSVVLKDVKPNVLYDNFDPDYYRFFEEAATGPQYEGLFHRFRRYIFGICKILPYDPAPVDIPMLGSLPWIKDLPALVVKNRLYNALGAKIHDNVTLAPRVFIDASHPELIEIESGTVVGDAVTFRPYNTAGSPSKIHIGHNVKIGSESVVMACDVGDNTQINIRSVVIGSVPSNAIVAGAPARVISSNPKHI
jgi:acetyltransferase-like isoleucine patch superfamily enzyme